MAELYAAIAEEEESLAPNNQRKYWDRKTYSSLEEQQKSMSMSSTLYIGNISFYTSENQLYEIFSRVGTIKRIIMGLDRFKKTPCGFCFAEYMNHEEALACANYLNGTKLDDRVIRCEMDGGFVQGRQFGRGHSGGQVRDDRRSKDEYDPGRGGYGKADEQNQREMRNPFRRSYPIRKRSKTDYIPESKSDTPMDLNQDEENPRFRTRQGDIEAREDDAAEQAIADDTKVQAE